MPSLNYILIEQQTHKIREQEIIETAPQQRESGSCLMYKHIMMISKIPLALLLLGWGCSPVVECLSTMCEALGLIPKPHKKKNYFPKLTNLEHEGRAPKPQLY
jgi:hypothetical protein